METLERYSPQRIADRMQIQDVMYRWCRAVDRLDYNEIRSVFHPDANDSHGVYNGGIEGLIEWIRERHKSIPFSMHQVSNMLIEFASPDVALAETYLRTTQRYPKEAMAALAQLASVGDDAPETGRDLWTCSRYLDRFERRNGEWRIADRVVIQDWKLITPLPQQLPQNVPGSVVGRRDSEDPMFLARRELGISAS